MNVLVAYASKHGSTEEIARAVAERLAERGISADIRQVGSVTAVDGYDAVILGSAVYAGSWMKGAARFARSFGSQLLGTPVWLFSSGPTDDSGEHGVSDKQRAELEAALAPRGHRVFGGNLRLEDLGFVEKRIVRMVKAPTGDFRDWDEIRGFADAVANSLATPV